jgi:hypothetical protein
MATKKKAAVKKAAPADMVEIVIQADGSPSQPNAYVDPNKKKHPSVVYWQAFDLNKNYQIVLDNPPKPFTKNGPFETNADGRTDSLTVDPKLDNKTKWTYHIQEVKKLRKTDVSGGGIIIDE